MYVGLSQTMKLLIMIYEIMKWLQMSNFIRPDNHRTQKNDK